MNLKEKTEKSTKLVEHKITIKKLKKQVQGITLIALVVTIIVLLILAGVAISLTIGQNGIFSRAQDAASIWRNSEANEQLAMGELTDWIDEVTRVDGVPIPNGFYYAGGSKDTGLVISDNEADKKEFSEDTKRELVSNDLQGNQFVWVPVSNPTELFTDVESGVKLNVVETKTNIYSNLIVREEEKSSFPIGTPGETSKVREPDVLSSYDIDEQYYKEILEFNSTIEMANSFVAEYNEMANSIKKYKGFYIGRYELTGTVAKPREKAGTVLTADLNKAKNWYNLYKACKSVIQEKENVKSTMIYGVQWDAVCNWLKKCGYNIDSSDWENYDVTPIDTGSNMNYQVNGIFDLAGNYYEWTQEAFSNNSRVARGGCYSNSATSTPVSDRNTSHPDYSNSYDTSRAILYLK